jgi:hypothetical protein
MNFQVDNRILPILDRFELGLLARLRPLKIDRDLLTAVVERWRRETHTFHFPIGEMTITLQDVLCLWGLPIDGLPVTGDVDDRWDQTVIDLFGRIEWASFRKPPGTFHMSRVWLGEPWADRARARLPQNAGQEEIEMYARGYMLDLFSSRMFPDQSGFIQTMYIQFILDLENPPRRSWGSAVLARLYRALCDGCEKDKLQMGGPLQLLQLWVWTRFPIGCPRPNALNGQLPYGGRWSGATHKYEDEPHRSISFYRYIFFFLSNLFKFFSNLFSLEMK